MKVVTNGLIHIEFFYVYYVDTVGPGQWVSVTKTGPQGPEGPTGPPGGIGEAPTDGQTYGRRGSDTSWVPVTAAGAFSVEAFKT